jgi:dephospho-CoA kinase
METDLDFWPCKIVIIGLPYSGKKTVASILQQNYECSIIDIKNVERS